MSENNTRTARWQVLPPEKERKAWSAWFALHGINPYDVAMPGWVTVDDETHVIIFWGNVYDSNGKLIVDGLSSRKAPLYLYLPDAAAPFPVEPFEPSVAQPYVRRDRQAKPNRKAAT